mgnify:FL=1
MDKITDIIVENEGFIYNIINKYKNYFELEDLYQVAVIGMIKAYKNYQEEYNTKFLTYAYPYVIGEVIKYVNTFRKVKLSKEMVTIYSKIIKAKEVLSQKLMKTPTIYELSLFLEIDENLIEEVIIANESVTSLDKIINEDDKKMDLYNTIGYYEKEIEDYPLRYAIEQLPEEERQLIIARFYENKSQREVGEMLGIYQVEVSRREQKILKKIHEKIAAR